MAKNLSVVLEDKTHKDFHKAAKKDYRTASDALRLLIEDYIKKQLTTDKTAKTN